MPHFSALSFINSFISLQVDLVEALHNTKMDWKCFSKENSDPCPECRTRLRQDPRVQSGTIYPYSYTSIHIMSTRTWCSICTLIYKSVVTWLGGRDPSSDERMTLMNSGYVGITFLDFSLLRPKRFVPGSLVILVGAWDCTGFDMTAPTVWTDPGFSKKLSSAPDVKFALELYTTPESGKSPSKAICHGRHYSSSIFDDSVLDTTRSWLNYCGHRHRFCRQGAEPELPRRAIDVSGEKPRLHVSADGETGEYVCLSHRWGPPEAILKSEKATVEERMREIPLSILPPTFRDAVDFTRRIGYRYLWIDSLCIIQDDPSDWEQEAAKMGLYYENSVLTLSVLQGHDPQAGCAWDAYALATTSITVGDCKIWCREIDSPVSHAQWQALKPDTPEDILFTRGWTLQESLLAPRLLFFTRRQAIWYCNSAFHEFKNCAMAEPLFDMTVKSIVASLAQPDNIFTIRDMYTQVPRVLKDVITLGVLNRTRETSPLLPRMNVYTAVSQVYMLILAEHAKRPTITDFPRRQFNSTLRGVNIALWYKMVIEYAARKLTYQSDKLVALSSLARKFSVLVKADYLAGLWLEKDYIRAQLAWELLDPESETLREEGEMAAPCLGSCCKEKLKDEIPSWSWASVNGDIFMSGATQQFYLCHSNIFNVLEGKCTTGADPFGRVTDGYLRVDARLGSAAEIGAEVSCTKDVGRDRYELSWNPETEQAIAGAKGSSPTVFYGNSLGCSKPEKCILGQNLIVVPLATTDSVYIPKENAMTLSVRTAAMTTQRNVTHLSVLICIDVEKRHGLRTLRRVGACSIKVKGKLSDLGWFADLAREELVLV